MAGTTETIQQGPIASRQRQLQARYNLMRSESLRGTSLPSSLPSSTTPSGTPSANIRTPSLSNAAALGRATGQALRAPVTQMIGKKVVGPAVNTISPSLAGSLGMGGGAALVSAPLGTASGAIAGGVGAPGALAMQNLGLVGPSGFAPPAGAGALGGAMAGLGALGAAAGVMMAVGGLAQHFFGRGRDPNPKVSAMRGVVNQINSALAQGPGHWSIPPVNIFGKGNVGNPLGPIISKFAIPGKRYSDDIINKKVKYALNKTDEARREFTSLLTKEGIQRTDELVEVELSKILRDTNKTGLIRRGDVKAQFGGKKFKFGNMTVERLRESLKNEIIPRQPGRSGISQIGGMQSEITTEAFTKALEYAFETKMGEQQEQLQSTQEQLQSTTTSMATGGMGRISSGSGMGAAPRTSQHGMASQA